MSTIDWLKELNTKPMAAFLSSVKAAETWFPGWEQAIDIFADYGQHTQQDRIMRLLVRAYQSSDLRAGPAIVALLWRRISARCCGDSERSHTLVVALLEVCARIDDVERHELPMILIQAAGDRIKARGPHIKTTAISDLIPCAESRSFRICSGYPWTTHSKPMNIPSAWPSFARCG